MGIDLNYRTWFRRLGIGSLIFFLIKGLAWLVLLLSLA